MEHLQGRRSAGFYYYKMYATLFQICFATPQAGASLSALYITRQICESVGIYGTFQTTVSSWSKKSNDGPGRLMSSPVALAVTSVYRRSTRSFPSRSVSCKNGEPSGQVARAARVFQCVSTRRNEVAPLPLALKSRLPLPSFPKRLSDDDPSPSTLKTIRLFLPWS